MTEKDFINKIHRKLPKSIYKWKIRDTYHGGVPDAYYSGVGGCIFIEYKYEKFLPKKPTTRIPVKTTTQQKQWLLTARSHCVPAFVVLGVEDKVVITSKVDVEYFTQEEFLQQATTIDYFVEELIKLCQTPSTIPDIITKDL